MNRRGFLGRAVLAAVAVIGVRVTGAPPAEAAELSEVAQVRAILAEPEKHPEIMARARELTGESGYLRILAADGSVKADYPTLTFGPSYGGVALTRNGKQVICLSGEDVCVALMDPMVVHHIAVMAPALKPNTAYPISYETQEIWGLES